MYWTIKSYKEVNHTPVVKIGNEKIISAKVGDRIDLNVEKSTDPDGDKLTYKWFYYGEPETFAIYFGRSAEPL